MKLPCEELGLQANPSHYVIDSPNKLLNHPSPFLPISSFTQTNLLAAPVKESFSFGLINSGTQTIVRQFRHSKVDTGLLHFLQIVGKTFQNPNFCYFFFLMSLLFVGISLLIQCQF